MSGSRPLRSTPPSAASPLRRLWSKLVASPPRRAVPAEDPGHDELDPLRRALRLALDGHPEARAKLRHAAVLEKELKRRGRAAFERLPAPFLYRANQQLAGIERDGNLRPLRREIDRALAARSSAGAREGSGGETATSAEFVSLVDVAEDGGDEAWREFQRLLSSPGPSSSTASSAGASDFQQTRPMPGP